MILSAVCLRVFMLGILGRCSLKTIKSIWIIYALHLYNEISQCIAKIVDVLDFFFFWSIFCYSSIRISARQISARSALPHAVMQ